MPELVIATFDVSVLSDMAAQLMKAAVQHAYRNQQAKVHDMQRCELCSLAGLPLMAMDDFDALMLEACKALVVVEVIDSSCLSRDNLPYASWQVFKEVWFSDSSVSFEIGNGAFEETLMSSLPLLRPLKRFVNQKAVVAGRLTNKHSSAVNGR
jgi:hypothetical protein